jgi:uncharacterized membrane protein
MKKQILGLILLTAFIASLMLVSAVAVSFTTSTPATLTKFSNTTTFTITAIENVTLSLPPTVSLGNVTVSVSHTAPSINTSAVTTITLTTTAFPTDLGVYTGSLLITHNSTDNQTLTLTFNEGLCSVSNNGELTIDKMEINVLEGFGKDDEYLYPLDQVEAKVKVSNDGESDIKNIEMTACLLDKSTGECVLDEDDMEISEDSLDIDSGDDVYVTLTFEVDPDKLDVGDNDYTLYIGGTGEVDDSDSAYDGDSTCSSDSEDIEIRTDDTFAIISNVIYTENVNCGDMLEISADVYNIGDEDLEDDEVYFEVYNKELGIKQKITFDDGIDSMSKESVSFSTKISSNVSEKAYTIQLSVLDHHYDIMQDKEDDESKENIIVNVGKCTLVDTTSQSVSITAELSEDTPKAVIGEQFVVESTIKNTGSSSVTYNVSVSGNSAWSEVSSIEPSTFTLASGESKKVSIYFNVDSDAKAGDKDFTIKVSSGSKTTEQKVAVTLEEGLTSSKILKNIKDNSFVYSIVLINLILLIAIIIVIVKMFGRKSDD